MRASQGQGFRRAEAKDKRFFTPYRLGLLFVASLSAVLYIHSLQGLAIWDDTRLMSGDGIGGGTLFGALTKPFNLFYYRPLTSASYWLDLAFLGPTPLFWHQTNVILHVLGALAVSLFAKELSQSKTCAILAGVFFAVQPAQVGAVAWIGGRTDALSALWTAMYLLSATKWIRTESRTWLGASCILLLVAALTKEQNLCLILAAPLGWMLLRGTGLRTTLQRAVPGIVVAIVFAGLWVSFKPPFLSPGLPTPTLLAWRFLASNVHYTATFLAPNPHSLAALSLTQYLGIPFAVLGAAILAAWAALLRSLYRSNKAACWLLSCAAVLYLPICNLAPIPSLLVGPYRAAALGVPIAVLMGLGVELAYRRRSMVAVGVAACFLVWSCALCLWGNTIWQTYTTWFGAVQRHDPHGLIGAQNRVVDRLRNNDYRRGLEVSEQYLNWLFRDQSWRAAERQGIAPQLTDSAIWKIGASVGTRLDAGEAIGAILSKRASAHFALHDFGMGANACRSAIASDPKQSEAMLMLGDEIRAKDRSAAIRLYERAVESNPNYYSLNRLGQERLLDKRYAEAEELLSRALEYTKWIAGGWLDLAEAQAKQGRWEAARASVSEARRQLFFSETRAAAILAGATGKGR